MTTSGPITGFPAQGLRNAERFITGHNGEGKAVFLETDHGDHHQVMVEGAGVQNIIYSTNSNPVELTDNVDIAYAKENKPPLFLPNGSVVRMIDFGPGACSNMHRAVCLGYGTVCEGEFELSLDSGEKRVLRPGDVSVNRGGMHMWRNLSPDKAGRMLFVLLDVKPVIVNGKALEFDMGYLGKEYE